jgi:hypothetical protein
VETIARRPDGGLLLLSSSTIVLHRELVLILADRYRLVARAADRSNDGDARPERVSGSAQNRACERTGEQEFAAIEIEFADRPGGVSHYRHGAYTEGSQRDIVFALEWLAVRHGSSSLRTVRCMVWQGDGLAFQAPDFGPVMDAVRRM